MTRNRRPYWSSLNTLCKLARLAPLCALLALACVLAPEAAWAQVVVGRVVDAASGAAVPQARVVATRADLLSTRSTLTGADGRFSLALDGGGAYRLEVARVGYRNARPRTLRLRPDETVRVAVSLSAAALRLAPLTATAKPRRLNVVGAFRALPPDSLDRVEPASASGAWGRIQVRGTFPTPSVCYQLAGAGHRDTTGLTLVVEARPSGEGCAETGGVFTYKATVRGLRPGTYPVRIIHTYRDDVWENALALDTTVTVR